jgi:hypothetical protein
MNQLGRLEAAITILEQHNQETNDRAESERRQVQSLLREMTVLIQSLETFIESVPRIERALSQAERPEMLRGRKMAARVDMHPETLRELADSGRIPGYQISDDGHWSYDPAEVVEAVKNLSRQRQSDVGAAS